MTKFVFFFNKKVQILVHMKLAITILGGPKCFRDIPVYLPGCIWLTCGFFRKIRDADGYKKVAVSIAKISDTVGMTHSLMLKLFIQGFL